ncbi:MAG: hypothetical protein QOJ12_3125, partial [Thermoleophilales bacterium]|nr:hypothetical protein [Thermoleophilales bacterium]
MSGALEIQGRGSELFDEPLALRARGAGPADELVWRARLRDDDGRVWRSRAETAEGLATAWVPAKETTGPTPALESLRPVRIDVRVESPDGRTAARTFMRRFTDDGVRVRRWRDGLAATLHLPLDDQPCATVLLDATAGGQPLAVATLAAPLLASRGAVVLTVPPGPPGTPDEQVLAAAADRLMSVPGAGSPQRLPVLDPFATPGGGEPAPAVVLPPGIGARDGQGAARARAV